ncbi:non-heme iron oxygenase ferredoxin subunit [Marispirochaeta sp.]|jgi:3-phenylpropionate/trans-cinnamate dioxygenase ferredoxin component|uniref:non-heme iron oxygenase ferredoxin subunit n=1 Tax=Marispirochaeta sp. TaxID=2038653 RepID=UPI0029C73970|nr:non-heme iron oxygenase ferredoxin subunit [Marispirochaeta sp.]
MPRWKPAVKEDQFRNSTRVEIDGKAYALFRLEDGIYALDDICSHEYSRLSEGEIWDGEVYCPKHGSRFDIRNGQVRSFPAMVPVSSYPVRIEEGTVYIDVEGRK